jgi:hypothetical protein
MRKNPNFWAFILFFASIAQNMTGIGSAWIGFALFYSVGIILTYNFFNQPFFSKYFPWQFKMLFTVMIVSVICGLTVPKIDDYVQRKDRCEIPIIAIHIPPPIFNVVPPNQTPTPKPPDLAKLIFSFYTLSLNEFPMREIRKPLDNGVVTITVFFKADKLSAKNGWLIVGICGGCKYAEEPAGTVVPQVGGSILRERKFEEMYAGTVSEPITLKIIPPDAPYNRDFLVAGRYVCDNCPPDEPSNQQLLHVFVTP